MNWEACNLLLQDEYNSVLIIKADVFMGPLPHQHP